MQGRSAVVRLSLDAPIAVGAPLTTEIRVPEQLSEVALPRGLLLALEAGRRLDLDDGPVYGLVVGLSNLRADPTYLEHVLAHRDEPDAMGAVEYFRDDRVLDLVASQVAASGPRIRIDSACASGSDALIVACQWIEQGYCEDVVVIAAASMLDPVGLALFRNIQALNEEDDLGASRPFDRRRRGFVMGEGAAGLWLSARQHETVRGWVCGYGQSMNAFKLTDMPSDLGAMENACRSALGEVEDLAFISAHGTSTLTNDVTETRLYKSLLGKERAYEVPVSALKSMSGHCLGASSLIEIVVSLEALHAGRVSPTINLLEPDSECDLDYVANQARSVRGNFALSNAFAFGGHNSSLLLGREAPR